MFIKSSVAKTSLFFSLPVLSLGFYKQKLFDCHQRCVPQEPTALGSAGSTDSNIYCLPSPQSLQGHSCWCFPPGWGQERNTQGALLETALLTRQIFKVFPRFCQSFSFPEQRVMPPMDIWTCWSFFSAGAQLPPFSLSTHECSLCCCSLFSVMVVS